MDLQGKSSDGLVSKHLNRPISTRITKLALKVYPEISPNFFTMLTLLLGIVASILLILRFYIIGGVLYQTCSILDGCDGEIARYKKLSSKKGDFLDSVIDRIIDTLFLFSLGIVFLEDTHLESRVVLAWIVVFLAFSYLISYTDQSSKRLWNVGFSRTIEGRDTRAFIISFCIILFSFHHLLSLTLLGLYTLILSIFFLIRVYLVSVDKWPPSSYNR